MGLDYEPAPARRTLLVGAGLLVAVMVLGGGWLAWQGLTTPAPPSPEGPAREGEGLAATAVGFGAPRLVEGVPWGYPLTGQGALAAAVTAVAATGQADAVFDAERFRQVAGVVFAEGEAARQARQVEAARTQLEASGWADQPASRRMYYFTPLAARLTAFRPDPPAATVEVWAVTLLGVGDAGGAVFTTSTLALTADGAGATWSVTALESVEGPTPLVQAHPSAPGRVRAFLREAIAILPLPLTEGPGR